MKIISWIPFLITNFLFGMEPFLNQEYKPSLEIRVQYMPDIFTIDGNPTIYYELQLTNYTNNSLALKSIDIFDTTDSTIAFSFNQDDLKKRYSPIGEPLNHQENLLTPNASCIIYLELTLPNDKENIQLSHRVHFESITSAGGLQYVQGANMNLSKKSPIILGKPLSKGFWAAVYEPSWERGHRRVIYSVNGMNYIPGRFAIDFIRMDNQGHYANGDENIVKNWYGYSNDVLAVANGIVASTRNDFSESTTLSAHPDYTADKATGNYISIDIGNNHIAFYEHLKPGSIKVKPGQHVKKGDIIASLGFTGQSTGPHLHFHVANLNSPLGAEGIPFAFEYFSYVGFYTDFEKFGKEPWTPIKNSSQIREERPAPNSIIKF